MLKLRHYSILVFDSTIFFRNRPLTSSLNSSSSLPLPYLRVAGPLRSGQVDHVELGALDVALHVGPGALLGGGGGAERGGGGLGAII